MSFNRFSHFLASISREPFYVLNPSIPHKAYSKLNLSKDNPDLKTLDHSSSQNLHHYIQQFLKENQALIAYGGYQEVRGIYKRSELFNRLDRSEDRNIHLGVDLWCDAGSPIFAPLSGIVHSFRNNTNLGDYGPTIILKHQIQNTNFYTLYGHLSLNSIANLKKGQIFEQQEIMGFLGDFEVNGDYSPHLHFQIIKDIQDFDGDYPGVCAEKDLDFYSQNCPDPNLLLKIN